ncbi:MAG: urease accessory protein UreF [Leptolyngbyaceae bacterium]|nr:urease accessory protein UreF [Leptolyngbyaceae bacterium]
MDNIALLYSSIRTDRDEVRQRSLSLLHLLQLTSASLPVGAYSYSEGLESLVQSGHLTDAAALKNWLQSELKWGSIRMEGAIALRIYQAAMQLDVQRVTYWNQWLSASRETEELREQNWQMGRALARLFVQLEADHLAPDIYPMLGLTPPEDPRTEVPPTEVPPTEDKRKASPAHASINYVTAFAVATAHHLIPIEDALLGYLYSWASNLVGVGVKLIPLGQTDGQTVLCQLYATIQQTASDVMTVSDDDLSSCTWGLAIASMAHETLYSRLFRS